MTDKLKEVEVISTLLVVIVTLTIGAGIGYFSKAYNLEIILGGILLMLWVRLGIDIYSLKRRSK